MELIYDDTYQGIILLGVKRETILIFYSASQETIIWILALYIYIYIIYYLY